MSARPAPKAPRGPTSDTRLASRATIIRFAVTTALLVIWSSPRGAPFASDGFAAAMAAAALATGGIAALCREPFCGPTLNRWDEMAAYFAVAALGQTFAG